MSGQGGVALFLDLVYRSIQYTGTHAEHSQHMEKNPSAPEAFLQSKEAVRPSIGKMPKPRPNPSHLKIFLAEEFTRLYNR
jgi:hypothetical protein